MYEQERLQQPVPGQMEAAEGARAFGRATAAVIEGVRNFLAGLAEPFGGPQTLELLEPKVRARMTGQEKGVIDAYFHGV